MTVDRTRVNSGMILSIGYDSSTGTLEVEFANGGIYQYFDVPEHEYDALMTASSHGGYLAKNIKPHFRYARV